MSEMASSAASSFVARSLVAVVPGLGAGITRHLGCRVLVQLGGHSVGVDGSGWPVSVSSAASRNFKIAIGFCPMRALSRLASKGGLTALDRSAKMLDSLNPAPAQR